MVDPNLLTGFVADINDRCPGRFPKENPKKLIKIAIQKERRLFGLIKTGATKNIIYKLEGTRDLVYKEKNECHPGVIMMGLSGKNWKSHPKSVPMEMYAKYFLDVIDPQWLKRNDYEFV